MEIVIEKPDELVVIAKKLIDTYPQARVFAFYGKMGSGKTTFIKKICEYLQIIETALSPSFGIINEYTTKENKSVYHFDFYRIKSVSEFLDLGCEEYFYSGSYCFIEWPEKIIEFIPSEHIAVSIEEDNGKRIINF